MDRYVQAGIALKVVERQRQRGDRFIDASERHAERRDHANRILVAIFAEVLGPQPQRVALERNLANFDVEISREFFPAHLHRPADKVRLRIGLAGGDAPLAPSPFQRQSAEHAGLARSCGRATEALPCARRVPEIGDQMHAAVLDLGGLRILVLVDHVLVDRLRHQLAHFRLRPGRAEGRQILAGVAVEKQFVVHKIVDRRRSGGALREAVSRQPPVRRVGRVHVVDFRRARTRLILCSGIEGLLALLVSRSPANLADAPSGARIVCRASRERIGNYLGQGYIGRPGSRPVPSMSMSAGD